MTPRPSNTIVGIVQRVALALAAGVLAISAFIIAIGAVAFGLVIALGVALWALVRGRKPGGIKFVWPQQPFARRAPSSASSKGEVVDVQVREIPDAAQKPKSSNVDPR
jgi:hypothetical protein